MQRFARLAPALVAVGLLLTGCPGKKDGPPPVADAGPDLPAAKRTAVTLSGLGSHAADGASGLLAFRWTQVAGPPVVLDAPESVTPSFVAPGTSGKLTFRLVVTSDGLSAEDTVSITVANAAPVAVAGPDLRVHGTWLTSLDGSASTDPDGDPLTYTWLQVDGPAVALDQPVPGWARFTAPGALSTVRFLLVVSDGEVTAEDQVAVEVVDLATDLPPLASAGPDVTVGRGGYVTLSGTGYDPDGSGATFAWEQLSGWPVTLASSGSAMTWFQAPPAVGDLEFRFTVTGGGGATASDTVVVHVRNLPPSFTSSVLEPAHPRTDDELSVRVTASDPEGSQVTFAYAWQRNGVAVAGQDGPTFPASLTTRGDAVAVTVTASDGESAATTTLSATIEDAPPGLRVTFPAEVQHGALATGQATIVDPDGDAVPSGLGPVTLDFGPADLSVTPGGVVSWTPTLPMFDDALEVRFGLRLGSLPGGPVTAEAATLVQVRVVDAARPPAMRRAATPLPLHAEAMRARDLDGDGRAELLVMGPNGPAELRRSGGGYAVAWMAPFRPAELQTSSVDASTAVEAADLDGDSQAELFYGAGARLVRLDGRTRRETGHASAGAGERWHACEAADVDGDGKVELACLVTSGSTTYGSDGRLVVLDAASLALEFETATLPIGRSLAVGDVDADAALEIVTSGGFVYDGASRLNEWAYAPGFGGFVEVARPVAGGAAQIVGGLPLRGFSATLKTPLWEAPSSSVSVPFLVRDVDGDGGDDFVSLAGYSTVLQAHRWVGGAGVVAQVFSVPMPGYSYYGTTALVAGDFDGDGLVEAAWDGSGIGYGQRPLTIAGPLTASAVVAWQGLEPAPVDGPMYGARLARIGDGGAQRVAFEAARSQESDETRVALLDPATGLFTTSPAIGSTYSQAGGLAVADYDGDGVDELFLATASSYDPRFLAWDPFTREVAWTGTSLGSGYSYTPVAGVAAADMDADGAPDLVGLAGDGAIWVHDVRDQTLVWKSTSLGAATALEVLDLDGDGRAEVVEAAGGRVVAYGWLAAAATFVELSATTLAGVIDLAAGDLDADGTPEVYALSSDSWGNQSTVTRLDALLQPVGSLATGRLSGLFVEDLGPGRKNLVGAAFEPATPYSSSEGLDTLVAFDPVNGAQVWRSPPLWGPVTRDAASWFQLGGAWRLAFGTNRSMYLTR